MLPNWLGHLSIQPRHFRGGHGLNGQDLVVRHRLSLPHGRRVVVVADPHHHSSMVDREEPSVHLLSKHSLLLGLLLQVALHLGAGIGNLVTNIPISELLRVEVLLNCHLVSPNIWLLAKVTLGS